MRVFVTGGTGFVGRAIVRQLHASGHTCHVLTRAPRKRAVQVFAEEHDAELCEGSANDAHAVESGMRHCDAVIHLVGIISEAGFNTFHRAHVDATQTVVSAAEKLNVSRYIHMSALGTRRNAVARYHQTKWEAEEIVRSSSLNWTVFRPSVIFGPEDGFVNLLAKICRLSPIAVVMGDGRNKLQPIAIQNVAHCFVAALDEPRSIRNTYDLAGREVFTLDEIYQLILKAAERKRPLVHLPMPIAKLQATVMEAAMGLIGVQSPLTRDQLRMLQEDNVGKAEPAISLFQFDPVPFAEGIARYVR